MATTGTTPTRPRYAEAVLLGLLVHELVAGAVFRAIGLPGAAGFLWVVGTGLSLGYALIWLAGQARAARHRIRLVIAVTVLAAMIAATVLGAYAIGDALGTLLVAAVFLIDRSPTVDRWRQASGNSSRQRTGT